MGLQRALLDADADALDHGVLLVLVRMVAGLETGAEEFAEGLPETCSESAQEGLEDAVAALVGLAVDELDEHLALILADFQQILRRKPQSRLSSQQGQAGCHD